MKITKTKQTKKTIKYLVSFYLEFINLELNNVIESDFIEDKQNYLNNVSKYLNELNAIIKSI